jgi:glutamyl-Q tRNA(Asp) synthetase
MTLLAAEDSAITDPPRYRGRFAPSPTGPLHFGSLVAAVGSYLEARVNQGEWLLRIEDVDAPRTVPGAADRILRTLAGFGFEWDGEVIIQSRRIDRYHAALVRLQLDGFVYPCACSRSEIAARTGTVSVDGGLVYPGTCRSGLGEGKAARAWRLRVPDQEFCCIDRLQGETRQNLERQVGDFVLLRADGQYAYQLAVVTDDAAQGVNAVVRGVDLLASTARQMWLQQCLGLPTPSYAHLPVVVNAAGEKLSKQTQAPALDPANAGALLASAMRFLGHPLPAELRAAPLPEFWRWALANWSMARVPAVRGIFPGSAVMREGRA